MDPDLKSRKPMDARNSSNRLVDYHNQVVAGVLNPSLVLYHAVYFAPKSHKTQITVLSNKIESVDFIAFLLFCSFSVDIAST